MMTMLIGLTGKAGCGKDTIASMLHMQHGFSKVSYAAPLKIAISSMLGVSLADLEDRYFKEATIPSIGKSPRQMMQTLGTEWGRNLVNKDLWLILANESIRRHRKEEKSVVVTDVRFENEAQDIRRQGGIILHIYRNNTPAVNEHISEASVKKAPFDFYIYNNDTIEDLRNNVFQLVMKLYEELKSDLS